MAVDRDPTIAENTISKAETMLALAEVTGVDVDALTFLARRFEHRLGVIDAVEPARRREWERLMAKDGDELASAFKTLKRVVERGGKA